MIEKPEAEAESGRAMDDCFITDESKDDVYIDLDFFWRDMGGIRPDSPQQGSLEDATFSDIPELGLQEALSPGAEVPRSNGLSPSYNSEVSDSRTGCSEGFSESNGNSMGPDEKSEPVLQLSFAEDGHFRNVTGYVPDQANTQRFVQSGSDFSYQSHVNDPFKYSRADSSSNHFFHQNIMEDSSIVTGDKTSHDASCTESRSYDVNGAEVQDPLSESSGPYQLDSYGLPFSPDSPVFGSFDNEYKWMEDIMDEGVNLNENCNVIPYDNLVGHQNANGMNESSISLDRGVDMHAMRSHPNRPASTFSNVFDKVHNHIGASEQIESITSNDILSRAFGVIDNVMNRKYHPGSREPTVAEGITWSSSSPSALISRENYISQTKVEKEDTLLDPNRSLLSLGVIGKTPIKTSRYHDQRSVLSLSSQPGMLISPSVKPERSFPKIKNEVAKFNGFCVPNIGYQGISSNTFDQSSADEDDLQILEDISQPARQVSSMTSSKFVSESHYSSVRALDSEMVTSHSRPIPNDERVIYRVALQDLSQPKSESTPPEGLLAYPLLKHQRIALYWMVNKETKGGCCTGGILADDQGLGKTVSTISLILTERSPSSKAIKAEEQIKTETLNLDEDDEASDTGHVTQMFEPCVTDFHIDTGKVAPQAMGRPAAGTLVVCPTSVLRQWSDELHNKVTKKANLSVLVYHGSNRTKDPLELAKYDVVVTTYAIVSMEVPKQPNVDELDDAAGKPFRGNSSSKKRKLLGTMLELDKKSSGKKKRKNGDNEFVETLSGPLAKVGWFRVVLDEAQSIKNHRTQVARACWGLRAKRRWCLSGTPIQNSIDDLYSYFRFLRLEPYAVFKTFCEQIKVPINRNPKNGFKKLQAVLKTIMLRRTKGTLLDGEPIINLPPKTIELKQVDFSKEELDFYHTLEADSRAQFAEYAANGTVEQNYVNILLMLLRLRQACDHPLLVKHSSSTSKINSSIAMAKKLPRDRQLFLLNCLEASLAICGICNDPPEDAVVTVCGHVYCNQCICEHMLGDDPQCPAKGCKTRVSLSDVFSITSLRCALSDHVSPQTQGKGHELSKVSDPRSSTYPQDSSKIKACLEILLSMSKPLDCASRTSSSGPIGEGCHSGKLELCDLAVENATTNENINPNNVVKLGGEKAIVFSQWTKMLDLLEACLKNTSIQYRRLDGTMPVTARDRAVKDFNTLPQVTVMIMSLKAASLGLNMVAACRVVLLDLWWNPTTEDQAIDRAHRIGQTRAVSVFRLTVKDTVEDRILALQQRKRQMVASAFGEDETGSRQTRLTVDDLRYLFRVD